MRPLIILLFVLCLTPCVPAAVHAAETELESSAEDDLIWGTVSGRLRQFYYRQSSQFENGDDAAVRESLAVGGHLKYETPWVNDLFQAGVAGYVAAPYLSSLNRAENGGTNLLKSDNGGIAVIGEAYLSGRAKGVTATAFRQKIFSPVVNSVDNRMIPILFEGVAAEMDWVDDLRLHASWLEKIKLRNADVFQPMSAVTGNDALADSKRGMLVLGGDWKPKPFTGKAWFYAIPDYIQTAFFEARAKHDLNDDLALRWLVQALDQRSLGSADGGGFNVGEIGVLGGVAVHGVSLDVGVTAVDETTDVEDAWGDYPFFNKMMVFGNNRAGEQALYLATSYDFSRIGWDRFSSSVKASFSTTPDEGDTASADRNEYNLNFGYRFDGPLEGLSLQHRWAFIEQRGDRETLQVRLRLQYDFSLN